MPIQTHTFWVCDLCGGAKMSPRSVIPEAWVQLTYPVDLEKGTMVMKVICPECTKLIKSVEPDNGSPKNN